MNIPHVIFGYDIAKDVENLKIGLKTVAGGRKPDAELYAILEKYGQNPTDENIREFASTRWEGREEMRNIILQDLQGYWDSIEEKFFPHLADRMKLESFFGTERLNGFLSLRYGSGYGDDWFAVSAHDGVSRNTLTAMHETMHIFFHKQWWEFCSSTGLQEKNIWDIKEAVTVLLNLWFGNLTIDVDYGYEEHTELRKYIKKWYLDSRDFKKTLELACEYAKTHPEAGVGWAG